MGPIKNVVIGTTLYLVVYIVLSSFQQTPDRLIIGMFSLSPFIVLYMVFRILTAGESSILSFDDSFYEDAGERVNVD